jgi:hypothetical protein
MTGEGVDFEIQDVAIFPTPNFNAVDAAIVQDYPPLETRISVKEDVYIERVQRDFANQIMDACEPQAVAGFVRQFGQLYSFIRKNAPSSPPLEWDSDERLQICMGLSRIVHPTTISFRYSARIRYKASKLLDITPGPVSGFGAQAFISSEKYRNWLTESEGNELAGLVGGFFSAALPARIRQALWYLEYAFRTHFIDVRWPLICMGLESLIHTDKYKSTKQFSLRVSKLVGLLGMESLAEDKAEEAYVTRSLLVHGQKIGNLEEYQFGLYQRLEDILREAIKKSILDKSFAEIFASDDRIREMWPLE